MRKYRTPELGRSLQSSRHRHKGALLTMVAANGRRKITAQSICRRAFSLMELLVVISIIGILTSLLLPAVQMAREAARRTQCRKNLKELALAAHNFESTFQRFPAGADNQMTGCLVSLLPYLDQTPYYNRFQYDPQYVFWWKNPLNRPPTISSDFTQPQLPPPRPPDQYDAEGVISTLLCPSAVSPLSTTTILLMNLHGTPFVDFTPGPYSTNSSVLCGMPGNVVVTRSSYGAVGGDFWYQNGLYRGIFRYTTDYGPNALGVKVSDITDGTSNTLMFGECAVSNVSNIGPNITSTFSIGSNEIYFSDGFNGDVSGNTFGSTHPGIIHFVFADGHVVGISGNRSGSIGPTDPGDNDYSAELNEGPMFKIMLQLGGIADGTSPPHD